MSNDDVARLRYDLNFNICADKLKSIETPRRRQAQGNARQDS